LLLAGHLHTSYSGDVRTRHKAVTRSILSVQAGTATSTRQREQANAYNLITIRADEVTIQVRGWTGERFEESAVTRYVRQEGTWKAQESAAIIARP
jgi:hypothetical protein